MKDTIANVLRLLDRRQRRRFLKVVLLMLATALAEVVGVSSISPFLAVLGNPGLLETNRYLSGAYQFFDFGSTRAFLVALGCGFLAAFFLSLVMRGLGLWGQSKFAHETSKEWSVRLVSLYLAQPYEWFLRQHSSKISSSILNEVDNVVWNALVPVTAILSQLFVVVLLTGLLLLVDPYLALGASSLMAAGFYGLSLTVKNRLRELGDERWEADRERFRVVNEAFGGVRELKLLGLEEMSVSRFLVPAAMRSQRLISTAVLSQLPSLAMQGLLFGGMMGALLYLVISRGSFESSLPVIGLYALAGMRMMPAIQKVSEEAAKLRGATAMVASLARTSTELRAGNSQPVVGRAFAMEYAPRQRGSLILENVSFGYAGSESLALDNLSLRIELGQSVGIVGASGSGKSTLVDILLGLLKPSSGTLLHLAPTSDGETSLRFGYVPQQIFLTDDTVESNIAYGIPTAEIVHSDVVRAAELAQLHQFIESSMPNGYATTVGERGARLSGGQRQRIGIARALYRSPNILVLDEATSALDNITEREVMKGVRSLAGDRTLIIVAHRLTTVRDCDVIFLLEKGRVAAAGTYDDLVKSSEYFAELAGHT